MIQESLNTSGAFVLLHSLRSDSEINPFTAMLAAPSLGKRPIKVPNLMMMMMK